MQPIHMKKGDVYNTPGVHTHAYSVMKCMCVCSECTVSVFEDRTPIYSPRNTHEFNQSSTANSSCELLSIVMLPGEFFIFSSYQSEYDSSLDVLLFYGSLGSDARCGGRRLACLLRTGSVPARGCSALSLSRSTHKFCGELHYSVSSEFQMTYHEQGLSLHNSRVTFQPCDFEFVFILEQ